MPGTPNDLAILESCFKVFFESFQVTESPAEVGFFFPKNGGTRNYCHGNLRDGWWLIIP